MTKKLKILLASPRGFCAGVDRAIEIVKKTLEKFGSPVYVRHEIVHNTQVVENLKKLGAVFVEELNEINDRSRPVIFSAHGVPKSVPEEALVGHKDHPEVLGTMGQLPKDSIKLIETARDAENINTNEIKRPVAYVTQTTLSVDDTKEIIEVLKSKFPNIKSPVKEDICYATTNRQEAVKKIAPLCDMFFVVGSKNSSNSQRLVEVAIKSGCIKSELIPFNEKLPIDLIVKCNKIGITSGASAPEQLVLDLISEVKKHCSVSIEEIILTKENVTFKLPKSLN